MRNRKTLVSMLIIAVFLVLAACGGGGGKQGQASKTPSASAQPPAADTSKSSGDSSSKAQSSIDEQVAALKSSDGQQLLLPPETKEIPPRPADPQALPEDDAGHWYDLEYLGWNEKKVNIPKSPGNGPQGKKIILILRGDHPYFTAFKQGAEQVAKLYGMQLSWMSSNWSIDTQAQQVDQAINQKPDLIYLDSTDANAVGPLLRKINQANIPVITRDAAKGLEYALALTGPDDWGQFRKLAKAFAEKMNYEGGYTIVQHMPGGLPFYARTYAMVTELKKIAPKMKLLDKQPTGLTAEKTMQVTADWITRFGPELKGIVSADDGNAMIGINQAVKNANRNDIVRVAAGNSKQGMDGIKAGDVYAVTYQSAATDGAMPVKIAADWFSGKKVSPVNYLPQHIITAKDVDQYMPAQW